MLAPGGVALVNGKKTVKPVPEETDEWSHYLHGPDNNAVSKDRQVGVSRNLQWIMPPLWARHHNLLPSISAMVSARGRLYYIIDEGSMASIMFPPRWALIARDAYNGVELWRRPIPNWGSAAWAASTRAGSISGSPSRRSATRT